MRVIVDTSIWFLALRRQGHIQNPEAGILKKLIQNGEDIYPKNAFGFYFSGQTQDLSQRQGKDGWTKRSILF